MLEIQRNRAAGMEGRVEVHFDVYDRKASDFDIIHLYVALIMAVFQTGFYLRHSKGYYHKRNYSSKHAITLY